MNTYRIFTLDETDLIWECKANSEDEVWSTLEYVKKIKPEELKKLYKIKIYVNRTSNDDKFVND